MSERLDLPYGLALFLFGLSLAGLNESASGTLSGHVSALRIGKGSTRKFSVAATHSANSKWGRMGEFIFLVPTCAKRTAQVVVRVRFVIGWGGKARWGAIRRYGRGSYGEPWLGSWAPHVTPATRLRRVET